MVESTPLLRERSRNVTEGSNPSRSAINFQIRPHLINLPWFAITPQRNERDENPFRSAAKEQGLKAAGALATNQIKRAKRANLAWPEHSEGNPSRSAINFQIRPYLIYLP